MEIKVKVGNMKGMGAVNKKSMTERKLHQHLKENIHNSISNFMRI